MTAIQPATRRSTIEVCNPADGTVVGEVPDDAAETVAAKASELRLFQPEWEALGPMRAAAPHGVRRPGIKPRGGVR